jgi:small subunit ribosomal protein S9
MVKNNFFAGVGRRKTAVAQTRVVSGNGKYIVNGVEKEMPLALVKVLELVDRKGKLDISVVVRGGGITGQVDAVILGVARALVELNEDFRSTLRKAGHLTRDARKVERKKPGLRKARRAPQWAKR